MNKQYFIINLNKAESAETLIERGKERARWIVFSLLIAVLLGVNIRVWTISIGYNGIIDKKEKEITIEAGAKIFDLLNFLNLRINNI